MTNKRAIIFGNGYSRKNIIWNDDHDVWACNLAFEEAWPIDVLVSTDANRQHQIYTSGYAEHHRCIFLDWNPAPPEMTPQMMEDLGYHTISNEPTGNDVVMSGYKLRLFFTYLTDKDCVESVQMKSLPRRFSAGGLAMWQAAQEGYDEILLAGFGDELHAYRQYTKGYDEPHTDYWKEEREFIINTYSNIEWRYI